MNKIKIKQTFWLSLKLDLFSEASCHYLERYINSNNIDSNNSILPIFYITEGLRSTYEV